MEILTKLTPAEVHLIREHKDVEFRDLLKYTFTDLLLKKVIRLDEEEKQSNPRSPVRILTYVSKGENFDEYKARPHETPFLEPFVKSPDLAIIIRHYIRMCYEETNPFRKYVFKMLLENTKPMIAINSGFLYHIFSLIRLTKEGKGTKRMIDSAINDLEKRVPELMESDPAAAFEILHKIQGNIYFLRTIDFEVLRKIDKEMTREENRSFDTGTFGCAGCFVYFDTYADSFDSGYDSSGAGGDSGGCSSCSGCSGCGGCGGCS
ncbi:MAG: hypothetical protein OEX02_18145 [Cyclobacteriaceae bacterium]|nr:hypothetical protein [Cyclobacteriaceae bacterium]